MGNLSLRDAHKHPSGAIDMTEHTDLVTIRFDLHEGDITKYALVPTPHIGIEEVLHVQLIDGVWEVSSTDPETHKSWVGRGTSKHRAILDYLKARLGMVEE
jgi:hypothetical protein